MVSYSKPESVRNFLKSSNVYKIPVFQRNYEWKTTPGGDIERFWLDLLKCRDGGSHFIGSFVLFGESSGNINTFLIIDGQQRLTTITLLLRALYNYLPEKFVKKENESDPPITYKAQCLSYFYKEAEVKISRMVQKDDDFVKIILESFDEEYKGKKRIAEKAYQYFNSAILNLRNEICIDNTTNVNEEEKNKKITTEFEKSVIEIYLTLMDKFKVVGITPDDEFASEIFESLNNTGKKLSNISLIRNYIMLKTLQFSKIDKDTEEIFKIWNSFEKLNTDEVELGDYLRTYLLMKKSHFSKSSLYSVTKEYIDDKVKICEEYSDFKKIIKNIFEDLKNNYEIYQVICGKKIFNSTTKKNKEVQAIKKAILAINKCGYKTHRCYLLTLFNKYDSNNPESIKNLSQSIQLIESYLIRRVLKRGLNNNVLEKKFADLSLSGMVDPKELYNKLKSYDGSAAYWPTDEQITESLTTNDFYSEDRSGLCATILSRIESNNITSLPDTISCEHIFSQEIDKTLINAIDDGEFLFQNLHKIGNLTLLTSAENSEAQNKTYKEKIEIYKNSEYRMTNEIPKKFKKWDKKSYEKRKKDLIDKIIKIWPRDIKS